MTRNKNGQRKVVVPIREPGGNSVLAIFNTNSRAAYIRAHIAKGTVVRAGEAACWDKPYERFEVTRIYHPEAYNLHGARVDMAEEYFSRLRRAETGIRHPIARAYLLRYEPWNAASVEAGENPWISAPIGNVIIARRQAIRPLEDNRLTSIHQTQKRLWMTAPT